MKNKKLSKVFIMMLIIIVGIGGACFAENPKCTEGIHNFDIDGSDAFICKDCGYKCDESTSTFGEWGYKHEVDGRVDDNNCIRYCTNPNHDHGAKAVKWKPHKDENKDGICDDCKYPCIDDTHDFKNNVCKKCTYKRNVEENEKEEKAENPSSSTEPTTPTQPQQPSNSVFKIKCVECGGELKTEYNSIGNIHYVPCVNNDMHCSDIHNNGERLDKCNLCKSGETVVAPENPQGEIFCQACLEKDKKYSKLEEKYSVLGRRHYRACTVDSTHCSYMGEHDTKGENGICSVCGYNGIQVVPENYEKTNYCHQCWYETDKFIELEEKYSILGEYHYRACTVDTTHCSYIEVHDTKGENAGCSVCGYKVTATENNVVSNVIFKDLPTNHWAYPSVKALVEAGILNGRPDGTFGTNDNMTAEEFFVAMSGVLTKKGKTATIEGKAFLADKLSNDSNWSREKYAELAKILGQKSGDNINELGAKEIKLILGNSEEVALENYLKPITREKVANLIGAFVDSHIETSVNTSNAKDWDAVDSIYKKRMNKLIGLNFVAGVKDVDGGILLNPDNPITRAEVAVMLNKLYQSL